MMDKQIKSRERVASHGEVFTADKEVRAMCDLVNDEAVDLNAKILEPACGEGNFLLEILQRRLNALAVDGANNFELNSLIALSNLYGIDILPDNVKACREKLFKLWREFYIEFNNDEDAQDWLKDLVNEILEKNIICGDALTCSLVDGQGGIKFTKWTIGEEVITQEYKLEDLMQEQDDKNCLFPFEPQPVKKSVRKLSGLKNAAKSAE